MVIPVVMVDLAVKDGRACSDGDACDKKFVVSVVMVRLGLRGW